MDRFNTFKLFIENNRMKIIIGIIFLIIMFISTIMFLSIDSKVKVQTENKVFSNLNLTNEDKVNQEDITYYFIEIKGQVAKPGVYSLEKGKRVVDAINIAGGLTDKADTSLLNQSIKLTDQMVIIIYSKEEIESIKDKKEEPNVIEDICQIEIKNDACICNNDDTVVIPNTNENNVTNNDDKIEKKEELNDKKININTATLETLMTLPKIGKVKAEAIISYRKNNKFNNILDIKNVKGIGDSLFEAIKDYITI